MVNRVGKKYGFLTVIERTDSPDKSYIIWRCLCDCGNYINVKSGNLNSGNTESCGCKSSRLSIGERSFKHGHNRLGATSTEYHSWSSMKSRCNNSNNTAYCDYGGRGITVCERWLDKSKGFVNFMEDMGFKPTPLHSIDRYPNTNGNYEPSNCRWGTDEQQCKNRRSNKWYDLDGVRMVQKDWAKSVGADNRQFHKMLKKKSFLDTYNHFKKRQQNKI